LSGSASARTLELDRTVSKILTIQLTGRAPLGNSYVASGYIVDDYFTEDGVYIDSGYWLDDYVISSAYQALSWPFVVSKDRTGPTVCIRNEYGEYIDGELDAVVIALPEQYMSNGQLLTR
jgi:hypothetical protein